jgi:hypothetical protein
LWPQPRDPLIGSSSISIGAIRYVRGKAVSIGSRRFDEQYIGR